MLHIDDVHKQYGGLLALSGASLEVGAGKLIGLIGPNGSGKSTLINVISGVTPLTSGRVTFDGHDITNHTADAVFRHGLIRSYQDPSVFFEMNVLDNATLPIRAQIGENPLLAPLRRLWRRQEETNAHASLDVLKSLQLARHCANLASDLSGGQMKLLELARTLQGAPKMMLLDEPTAGVAPPLAYQIFEAIRRLRDEHGITFLIIEHRLDMLFDFVDELYVMHMGAIIAHGSADDIAANPTVRDVYLGY
ncbi:MAG: ABC transporter ATP-binding protein [Chloroflexi bacterium]|nr:ABC transporter ATP-binding protein [Chloroflexota bacterium]